MIGIAIANSLGLNFLRGIFGPYKSRVEADGGVTEEGQCVEAGATPLLQTASLLLIPSGYKGGKLYAEIPTNGNGDLTWTRGGDAFRTNASGVLQRVPWNLLSWSEQFTDALWSKTNVTASGNTTTAPNGTTTADSLIEDSTNNLHIASQGVSFVGGIYTASVYVKPNGRNWVFINIAAAGSYGAYFDVANGVVGTIQSNITSATMTSVGNGWYRCIVTANTGATSPRIAIYTATANGTNSYQGDGTSGVYIWGAQLVEGTTAQTYLPTTDRLNFPRLSYMYGSCPSALLEPQRTNLALYSQDFDNAYWSKYLATVSANTATSPDGSTNADLVYPSSTGPITGQLFRQISTGISSGNVVTVSAFVKASGKNFAYLSEIQNSFTPAAYFNLTTGAITNISAGVTASMTQLTNSWWRISITSTAGAGLYYVVVGSTDSAGSNINTASGTNGILVYGYQCELGAYPTTIIPTTSATATRVADSFSRSNIYTNGLISASGGTWFVSLVNNVAYTRDNTSRTGITDDTTNFTNALFLLSSPSSRLSVNKLVGGAFTSLYNTNADITKLAIKWNGTTADIFANGTKVISATSFTPTNMQFLHSQGVGSPMFIQQMALFSTPLSDTDCTTLTTL